MGAPSPVLIEAMVRRAGCLLDSDLIPEGAEEARRALALAREIGHLEGEALALVVLSIAAFDAGDTENALEWAHQACRIDPAAITGSLARRCSNLLTTDLTYSGEVTAARRSCADGLALARQAGDLAAEVFCLVLLAELELRAGRIPEARADLREALELGARLGSWFRLMDCLDECGHLCAATGRNVEAITLWATLRLRGLGKPARPRRSVSAARNPCGRPRRRWDPPGRGRPRNAARR